MRITTKKGDGGQTSLYPCGIVAKDHPRIELVGALDELGSFLGMARCLIHEKAVSDCVRAVQKDLFLLGAEAATSGASLKKLKKRIGVREIKRLESYIGRLEAKPPLKKLCFNISGKTLVSSSLDVARTIARRAERRAVTLTRKGSLENPSLLVYLNRLSDFLYLLARSCEGPR